jgi:hypothetical protein
VPTDAAGTAAYRAMLQSLVPNLDGFLGVTFTLPVVLVFKPSTPYAAETDSIDAQGSFTGPPAYCRISLNPGVNTATPGLQLAIVGHELTHCYQAAILGLGAVYYAAPPWLIEGSAEWSGAILSGAPGDDIGLRKFGWIPWLNGPGKALFARSYDAIGFYGLLDQAGISPWSVLPAMLTTQTKGTVPDNGAAYHAATASAPQEVLDEWASSLERAPALGLDWDLKGPGIPPTNRYGGPKIQAVTLANGGQLKVTTPAYTASDYGLTSTAEVVLVDITGTSRLHDSASFERVTSANGSYCTKQGGCVCPQGSPNQGSPLPQLSGLLHLAVTGGPPGATGTVYGLTLSQFCGKTLPPLTQAFCQQLLSVAEANQIMNFPIPVTTIDVNAGATAGTCNYLYGRFDPLVIVFMHWTGPVPIPQQALAAAAQGLAGLGTLTASIFTPVSGVGDQAVYVAFSGTEVSGPSQVTVHIKVFYVLYGHILFGCANFAYMGTIVPTSVDVASESALQQCAQLVVSRLDP